MEGYLLVFTKERAARVWYCVLDCGLIKCFDAVDDSSSAVGCIELTRHRVRIKPLVGGSVCPNRFVLHTTEVKRNDQVGKLAATLLREQEHVFAASTSDKMCQWVNAIHNWRRHTFGDPLDGRFTASAGDQTCRRTALELDRMAVVDMATRFDIRLSTCRRKHLGASHSSERSATKAAKAGSTAFPKIRPISAISEAAARKVLFMRPTRASGVLASWLPSFSSSSSKRSAS